MKPILISLSPNTEPDDISLAWQIIFKPWTWKKKLSLDIARQKLQQYFPNQSIALTSSGRSALYHGLKTLSVGDDDEVIIQAFTCVAVPSSVQWVGAKPVYADIDPQTYNLDPTDVRKKITPQTKAIIVQHTFGIPGPIMALRQIADEHNIYLIEDCAHSLGATYNGRKVGSFGDISILSFGRDKAISSVFGGAVISKDIHLINKIKETIQTLPQPPGWWVFQQLLHPILMSFITRFYFTFNIGKYFLVTMQQLKTLSKAVTKDERTGGQPPFIKWQFSPALATLLINQIKKVDKFTQHRKEIAQQYQERLKTNTAFNNDASWLRFPHTVANKRRLLIKARHKQMLLGDWYSTPVTPCEANAPSTNYIAGSCPKAEQAAQTIVNLPTHPRVTKEDVDRIITFIKNHHGN